MTFESYTSSFKVVLFHELYTTVYIFSTMMSVNAIAFAVLRILHNLIYFQKSFLANNCNEKMRKVQCDHTFTFTELSENLDSFE